MAMAAQGRHADHQVELLRAERRDLNHTRALASVRGLAFTHQHAILADVEAPELRSIYALVLDSAPHKPRTEPSSASAPDVTLEPTCSASLSGRHATVAAAATRAARAAAHAAWLAARRGTGADIHRRHPGRTGLLTAARSAPQSAASHVAITPAAVRESLWSPAPRRQLAWPIASRWPSKEAPLTFPRSMLYKQGQSRSTRAPPPAVLSVWTVPLPLLLRTKRGLSASGRGP